MNRFAASAGRRLRQGLAVLIVAAGLAAATGAAADPALWTVKGPGATVDLFGSIHLLSDASHWRNPAFDAELAKSDALWFEIPLGVQTDKDVAALVQSEGLLPAGQTLSSLLPAPLAARVAALAARDGLPETALQRMRPWLAEVELTLLFYKREGYREDLGVEHQVDAAAPASARREAFETLREQIDLFASEPMAEQVASLKETLDEIDTDPGVFDRMAAAWTRGDVAALERDVVERTKAEDPELYQRILVDRNRRFAARIEELLRHGSGHVFVVVGAGHLVGPQGVPALLRRDGFKVQGP